MVRRDGVPQRGDEAGALGAAEEQWLRLPTTRWGLTHGGDFTGGIRGDRSRGKDREASGTGVVKPRPYTERQRAPRFRRLPQVRLWGADGRLGKIGEWVAAFEWGGKEWRRWAVVTERQGRAWSSHAPTRRGRGPVLSAFAPSATTGCGWTIRGNFSRGSSRVIGARTTGTGGNSSRSSGAGWAGVLVEEVRRSDRRKNWRWR